MRPLEDRTCPHRELLAATVTLEEVLAFPAQLRYLVKLTEWA